MDPRFRFFGNIHVGARPSTIIPHARSISLSSLAPHYTHLLFATGCTVPTFHPALPASDLVVPALSFVHWYTQHPSRPRIPLLDKIEHVTLIGQGNVSLDVARMLLTSPSVLEKYDVPETVLEVLRRSAVKHVSIVGRRGPLEAAFTVKELREMMNLSEASMVPLDPSLLEPPPDTKLNRQQTRTLQLLRKGSVNEHGKTPKTWSLDFFRSPTGLAPPSPSSPAANLTLAHTSLDSSNHAIPTGQTSTLATHLVVTSLGHRSDPTQEFYDPALGHLRTLSGRVVSAEGHVVRNVYASGWAAMGAKGVLASTMMDAYAVADTILSDQFPDVAEGEGVQTTHAPARGAEGVLEDAVEGLGLGKDVDLENVPEEVERGVMEGEVTQYGDWKRVDEEEVRRGEALGKERERMGWEEAREFLRKA